MTGKLAYHDPGDRDPMRALLAACESAALRTEPTGRGETMSDERPLKMRVPAKTPEEVLRKIVDIKGLVDEEHRVVAAAALVIRKGLDNLVEALDRQHPPE